MEVKPYLDKITTSPHFPKPDGQVGYVSTSVFPNLSHTGIRSQFEPLELIATAPDGKITQEYKTQAFTNAMKLHREMTQLNNRESAIQLGHKQFINKVLIDMEDTRQDQYFRRKKHWKTEKIKLGFSNMFDSSKSHDDQAINSNHNDTQKLTEYDSFESDDKPSDKNNQVMIGYKTSELNPRKAQTTDISKAYNRMQLFEKMLLDPEILKGAHSPKKKFATLPIIDTK